jgi:hypothetical protein
VGDEWLACYWCAYWMTILDRGLAALFLVASLEGLIFRNSL